MSGKYKEQFFTPEPICNLMSEIALDEKEIKKSIKEKGFTLF